jgi:hypothetical protein
VVLSVSEWPGVDSKGRLVFSGRTRTATVDREELDAVLRSRRRVSRGARGGGETEAAAQRPVAVGDVCAARVPSGRLPRRAESLLEPPVFDLGAQSREAAQASALAAVTSTLSRRRARRILDLPDEGAP